MRGRFGGECRRVERAPWFVSFTEYVPMMLPPAEPVRRYWTSWTLVFFGMNGGMFTLGS